jgi:hypothetical protein
MADHGAREAFEPEEHPTRPASPARTKTSRWRAVTSAALERGFGRQSDGEYDEGPEPGSQPLSAAASDDGGSSVPEPLEDAGVDVVFEPSIPPPAELPTAEPVAAVAPRALGPRGTVRMAAMPGRADRGPTGTMRIPSRAGAVASFVAWRPTQRTSAVLVVFAVLACAQFAYIVVSGAPAQSPTPAIPPANPVASAEPAPPLPVESPILQEDPPAVEPLSSAAAGRTVAPVVGGRWRKASHAAHAGSSVL